MLAPIRHIEDMTTLFQEWTTRAARKNHPIRLVMLRGFIAIELRNKPSHRDRQAALKDLAHLFDLGPKSANDLTCGRPLIVPELTDFDQLRLSAQLLRDRGWAVEVQDRRAPEDPCLDEIGGGSLT